MKCISLSEGSQCFMHSCTLTPFRLLTRGAHFLFTVSTDQLVAAGAYWNPLPLLAGSLSSPLTQLWAHQECASFWLQSPLLHMCIFSHPLILGGARQLDSAPFIHTQAEVPGISQGSLGCTTFFRIATGRPCATYNRPCPLSW